MIYICAFLSSVTGEIVHILVHPFRSEIILFVLFKFHFLWMIEFIHFNTNSQGQHTHSYRNTFRVENSWTFYDSLAQEYFIQHYHLNRFEVLMF